MNMKFKEQHLFEYFIKNVCHFDQFDLALLNRNIISLKQCYYNNVQ